MPKREILPAAEGPQRMLSLREILLAAEGPQRMPT